MVTVNSEGIIGGLRAVGNNPKLNIGRDSILNIILDESSIINMRPDSAYPVISGFSIPNYFRDCYILAEYNKMFL